MDATQMIDDPILESEEEDANKRGEPLAKLRVLKNEHIPETELPLYVGENVLGRDPNTCSLPLPARSVSKQHTVISISVFRGKGRRGEVAIEALVWDLGSMNGTRRGRFKMTPHVRYALGEGDGLVVADIPCQYVSCAVDKMAGQRDNSSPLNRDSGRRGRQDALKGKAQLNRTFSDQGLERSTNTDSEKHANGNIIASAPPSSSDGEETGKTPVRSKTLSFEQTPTQPQGTLVSASDSDSDGERGVRRDKRVKAVVSDSDSQMSSPACSTFLSPTNKVIPESEDESPITPSSSTTKNRPKKRVSFSEEERDVNVGRQQLKRKRAQVIVDDSDEEQEEGKEKGAALRGGGGGESVENGKGEVSVEQANDVSPSAGDGLPVSTAAVTTDALPAFNMDSDTDVEGEEVVAVASAVPVTLGTPPADPPTGRGQFHMDSDTDVDESDDALDSGPKPVPASSDNSKPTDCIPAVHPADLSLESDTVGDDDDDDDAAAAAAAGSDTATKSRATSVESVNTSDAGPSTQPKDFHLDSDTDVEEDKDDSRSKDAHSNLDETHSRMDPSSSRVESTSEPQNLQLDSDTDDEGIHVAAPVSSKPTGAATDAKPPTSAGTEANLEILSDSDTDLEEDGPLLPPATAAAPPPSASVSATTVATAASPQSESDADTDVEEPLVPPAGVVADPQDFRMDSDTDVEEEEETGPRKAVEGQTPGLSGEKASGLLWGSVPSLQKCSTPVGLSGGVEEMETQVFSSPSDPFRRPQPPALRPVVLSTDSQEDDDFIVAETQSFVLESRDHQGSRSVDPTLDATQAFGMEPSSGDEQEESGRAGSFQLGLSDSNHHQARALASESTQAFVSFDGDRDLEATQAYGTASPPDRASVEEDSELEATQAYGANNKPARRSAVFEKEGQVDFALDATQAYAPEPHNNTEDEGEERANIATAETLDMSAYTRAEQEETLSFDLPTRYNVATAETQPMSALEEEDEEEEDLVGAKPPSPVRRGRPRRQKERDEREENGEATQPQEMLTNQCLATAETQPMAPCDDEDSIPGPRKRRAESQRLVEEETQPFTSSELSTAETQPMLAPEDEGKEDEIVAKPPPPKRRGRSRRGKVEEEETQPFVTSAHISRAETQPISTADIDDEEEEETKVGPQKAKGRPRRGKGRESEAGTSGINSRGRGVRGGGGGEEEEEEPSEPPKRQTRGKGKAASTARGRRGKVRPEEEESEEEEEIEQVQRGKRRKSLKQLRDEREEKERLQREQKEQEDRLERERKEHAEEDRLQREKEEKSAKERAEKEKMEQELKEQEERERLEKERREREERQRMEGEKMEQEERERLEKERREEQERLEKERREREERERMDGEKMEQEESERLEKERREEQEQLERERRETEERERLEREKAERKEKERLEKEENKRVERERKEREEKERLERTQKEKEEQEKLEREKKEKEEREEEERLERERAEKERVESEEKEKEEKKRVARERKEQEEKERLESMRKEKEEQERLEREKKERERMEVEKKEQEERERLEKERREEQQRLKREREEKEEQERLEQERKEKDKIEEKARLEREESERVERERKEPEEKERLERMRKEKEEQERLEREKVDKEEREEKERREREKEEEERLEKEAVEKQLKEQEKQDQAKSEENKPTTSARGRRAGRRTTAAPSTAEPEPDLNISALEDVPARRTRSRSNSFSSVSSERSSASVNTQGSRGRGRGSKRSSQLAVENPTRASNRLRTMAGEPPAEREDTGQDVVSSDVATPRTLSRSRSFSSLNSEVSSSNVASQNKGRGGRGRGRGRKIGPEPVTDPVPPTSSQSDQPSAPKATARGRKSRRVEDSTTDASQADGEDKAGSQQPSSTTTRGRGRAKAKDSQPTAANEEIPTSQVAESPNEASLASVETSKVPRTPSGNASRKRAAPVDLSPLAKAPRSSSASPGTANRLRAASQSYKVLFTGVVDEAGEKVVCRLGGSMAKGVVDMTYLVTDKVRRTVKFLCAVARGVPIVTTHWLDKCGKAGSFLSPNAFIVRDAEQEKKFDFCLQESLRTANNQPLLQGYEIHVTKSVKPEPAQMKDIITCSGASFLPKMPSVHKAQTVVISCEEDWSLCGPAVSASLSIVTAEFILTGVLQQKIDLETHTLPAPASKTQSVGGRGRGRKKT